MCPLPSATKLPAAERYPEESAPVYEN